MLYRMGVLNRKTGGSRPPIKSAFSATLDFRNMYRKFCTEKFFSEIKYLYNPYIFTKQYLFKYKHNWITMLTNILLSIIIFFAIIYQLHGFPSSRVCLKFNNIKKIYFFISKRMHRSKNTNLKKIVSRN